MKQGSRAPSVAAAFMMFAGLAACVPSNMGESKSRRPTSLMPAGPGPRAIFEARTLHRPPVLGGDRDGAQQSARAFILWAGSSTPAEREDGRRAIDQARANPDVARALIAEFNATRGTDGSRSLVILAILGELRNPIGEAFLAGLVREPLPTGERRGPEGDTPRRHARELLQAKAVQGLAYAGTPAADALVIEIAARHPSRIVRAEAIGSYLWNHQDSAAARARLAETIRRDERIFLERVRRNPGERAQSFNRRLAAFLTAHPELRPPAPVRQRARPARTREGRQAYQAQPPQW